MTLENNDSVDTPSPAQKSESPQQENMIPQSRFNEVVAQKNASNNALKEALDRLDKLEKAEAERQRLLDEEQGNYQKIIAEIEPKAKEAERLTGVVSRLLQTEIDNLPERWQKAVPKGLSEVEQLDWIREQKASGLFDLPKAPDFDAGVTGDNIEPPVKASADDIEWARTLGMSIEKYMANKAAGRKFRGEE